MIKSTVNHAFFFILKQIEYYHIVNQISPSKRGKGAPYYYINPDNASECPVIHIIKYFEIKYILCYVDLAKWISVFCKLRIN